MNKYRIKNNVLLIIFLFIILAGILLYKELSGQSFRENTVVLIVFDNNIFRKLEEYDNVSIYRLDSNALKYVYRAKIILVITHTSLLDNNTLLLALNEPIDPLTIYGIKIDNKIYKAIPVEKLASKIEGEILVLIGCNITRDSIYNVFQGRVREIYYYTCPALPQQLINDIYNIIKNKLPQDPCFHHIIYGDNSKT